MGCHGHHSILYNPNRFIFGDNTFWVVVALNNFASMRNSPCVQGRPIKFPVVVIGGGGVVIP